MRVKQVIGTSIRHVDENIIRDYKRSIRARWNEIEKYLELHPKSSIDEAFETLKSSYIFYTFRVELVKFHPKELGFEELQYKRAYTDYESNLLRKGYWHQENSSWSFEWDDNELSIRIAKNPVPSFLIIFKESDDPLTIESAYSQDSDHSLDEIIEQFLNEAVLRESYRTIDYIVSKEEETELLNLSLHRPFYGQKIFLDVGVLMKLKSRIDPKDPRFDGNPFHKNRILIKLLKRVAENRLPSAGERYLTDLEYGKAKQKYDNLLENQFQIDLYEMFYTNVFLQEDGANTKFIVIMEDQHRFIPQKSWFSNIEGRIHTDTIRGSLFTAWSSRYRREINDLRKDYREYFEEKVPFRTFLLHEGRN